MDCRNEWLHKLEMASTPAQLRECLGLLEAAVVPAYLSHAYVRKPHVLLQAWSSPQRQQQEADVAAAAAAAEAASGAAPPLAVMQVNQPLQWLPPTLSAIALRMQSLDAAIYYAQQHSGYGAPAVSRSGRERMAGYRYLMRPAPIERRLALKSAADMDPDLLPICAQEGVLLQYTMTITGAGKLRNPVLFLVPNVLASEVTEFSFDVEDYRQAVKEAEASGTLYPAQAGSGSMSVVHVGVTGGPRAATGRSAAAKSQALAAQRASRIEAMQRASAGVRSAIARAHQANAKAKAGGKAAGGKGAAKGKAAAKSHKAKKPRQSTLSKEWENTKSDDEEDQDYGEMLCGAVCGTQLLM